MLKELDSFNEDGIMALTKVHNLMIKMAKAYNKRVKLKPFVEGDSVCKTSLPVVIKIF